MARKKRQPKTLLAALKKAARQEFGFRPPRISKNRRKYDRSREKHLRDDGRMYDCYADNPDYGGYIDIFERIGA